METTEARKAPGVRARVRAELTAEIKASARRQLITDGAASLSLRAIARELDMASSAIYRYFASRDELLTALIIDAYDAVGTAVEEANQAVDPTDYGARFIAMALTVRRWAVENPHEYALIYGSPVPGYAAPEDTIDSATRVPLALLATIVDCNANDSASTKATGTDTGLSRSLAALMDFTDRAIEPVQLANAVRSWGEMFGLISLELFGHFTNSVSDPEAFYTHAMSELADRIVRR